MSAFARAPVADENAARAVKAGTAAVPDPGPVTRGVASRRGLAAVDGNAATATRGRLAAEREVDIDAPDAADPACVSDYVATIMKFQRSTEVAKTAKLGYMSHQTDINEKMRAILIDWLVEVHLKFKLMPETMYLTVNLIDRFLERKLVVRQKLQLVGVTAMLLASKYEEIFAPEVRDFVYITDKAYSREQILAMETALLNALDFKITVPTVYVFMSRCLKCAEHQHPSPAGDTSLVQLTNYVAERSLQEYKMLAHPPSKLAAAAVNIALRTLRGRASWTPVMERYAGYTEAELRPVIVDVQDVMRAGEASTLQAVRKKYLLPKYGEVASIALAPLE